MRAKITVDKKNTFTGHKEPVYTLLQGKEDNTFYSAAGDGMVVEWDMEKPEEGRLVAKVPSSVYGICYHQERNLLIIGQNFQGLHFVDADSRKEIKNLKITTSSIFDIQVDSGRAYVACGDGELVVVDLDTCTITKRIKNSEKSARSISLNPANNHMAVGYSDNKIRVYDTTTCELIKVIEGHENSVFSVKYSPDGLHLLSGSRDAHLKIWNTEAEYALHKSIVAHMYTVNNIDFSKDGKHFATCSMDKTIKVWDASSFRLLKVIDKSRHAGHGTSVNKLLWSVNDMNLFSCSDDRSISHWVINEGQAL
ncbi:hypothetical protein AUTU_13040 [Aureibacter tunicatorum]|nr:hypothetical protein AUTU_13040 [Aureibacter tunicatorum]